MICIQGRMMGFSFGQENLKNEKKGRENIIKDAAANSFKGYF